MSEDYKQGLVATASEGGRIAAGCMPAVMVLRPSTGTDRTCWKFAKRRDLETCATWRPRKRANTSSLYHLQDHRAQRCRTPGPGYRHSYHLVPSTVHLFRSL